MYGVIFAIFLIVVVSLTLAFLEYSRPKREYGVKSVTARGEEVRSIGEKRVADYFARNNINYVYEREAKGKFLFLIIKLVLLISTYLITMCMPNIGD